MTLCGGPGMCGGRADCDDEHCPGRGTNDKPLTVAELLDVPPFSLDRVLMARFILGLVAVAIVIAGLGWLVHTIAVPK